MAALQTKPLARKPATPATKVKMASRILKTAAEAMIDAGKSKSVAIEEGLYPAD